MDITKPLSEYLHELSSNSPTPGGGNVAALCGALASSLGVMVCNLTIGKKKYAEVESEIREISNSIAPLSNTFVSLGKDDNAAFDAVMDAFKLPKDTDELKAERSRRIEVATLDAARVPATVISTCAALLPMLERVSQIGNQNSLSDAAVGISLTRTAAEGAYLNVLINCSSLSDPLQYSGLLNQAKMEYLHITESSVKLIGAIINKLQPVN